MREVGFITCGPGSLLCIYYNVFTIYFINYGTYLIMYKYCLDTIKKKKNQNPKANAVIIEIFLARYIESPFKMLIMKYYKNIPNIYNCSGLAVMLYLGIRFKDDTIYDILQQITVNRTKIRTFFNYNNNTMSHTC